MPCSEKKLQANRKNALKSTGPKSRAGKEKVALNALKHGLRSEMVVLPGEDAGAFDQMMASWMDDWQPPTDARRVLVELAVGHAWRLRRCLKVERDHLVDRGREAVRARAEAARERARAEVARLVKSPAAALANLLAEREGAGAVLGLWKELADAAAEAETWSDNLLHHVRLLNLLGLPSETCIDMDDGAAYLSWSLLEWNEPEPTEFADDAPADADEADAFAAKLSEFIAGQIAEVERYIATQFPDPEREAVRVAMQASLDDSAEGRALLRYEGQHGREFRATLNQLIKLTQTDVDVVEEPEQAEVSPQEVVEEAVESPSAPAPNEATEAVAAEPPAPNKPTDDDPVSRGLALFRANNGLPEPGKGRRNQ